MRLSISYKLMLLTGCMLSLTALAVNEVYSRGSNRILTEEAIATLKDETQFIKYPLDNRIGQLKDDAALLTQAVADKSVQAMLAATASSILRTRPHYTQIRFIRINGAVESFSLTATGFVSENAGTAEDTATIQATLAAQPGEVLLGEPELQKRQGIIIKPVVLTMRATALLFDTARQPQGVVVVTMDLGRLLNEINRKLPSGHMLSVTNSTGDYLLNPDPAKLHATELSHGERLQKDFPQVLAVMSDDDHDNSHVDFITGGKNGGNVLSFLQDYYDPLQPSHFIGIAIETPYAGIVEKTEALERRGLAFSGTVALAAVLANILLMRQLLRPLGGMADAIVRYRRGEKDIALPVDSPDEIGVLAQSFQAMIRQKDDEDWVKETLVSASRRLLGFKDLPSFSQALLESFAQALHTPLGALYINAPFAHQGQADGMLLAGAYGHADKAELPQRFALGEGLVGLCAGQQNMQRLRGVPEDAWRISSANAEAAPRELLLVPILFESTTVAVLELASLLPFSSIQERLVTELCFTAGVLIVSISTALRTAELLEETRAVAEELQHSEEELRAQQEELQATNTELEEQSQALEEQNAQIRRQSQQLVENHQLMERASRYKSEFLANMSHELRTPLNSLLILSRNLAANEDGNLNTEQVEEAEIIHNGGLELLELINDILDLSKVESGNMTVQVEGYALEAGLHKLKRQFEPVAGEKQLEFYVRLEADLPAEFTTDGQRFEQILKNLLANAFKFTKLGSVTLSACPAERVGFIAFLVTDTGIGIEPTKLKDIFEAFQQEDGATDRHYGGTGLGLTIARKFARLLGGEIRVESRKGAGSTFTLLLPLQLPGHKPVAEKVPAPMAQGKRLLIIEDDAAFAGILSKLANARGFETLQAADGKTGLELALTNAVSAIVLDLKLPDIDGLEVLERLKADPRMAGIPVHIISGRAVGSIEGAAGFAAKPLSQAAIDAMLDGMSNALPEHLSKLLVVEDDKATQVAIQRLLRKKNIDITFASSGGEALEQLAAKAFECVILDLTLPDMTGFAWLDRAEAQLSGRLPPIVVYTSRELNADEERLLARHTGSVVIKGGQSSERLIDEVTLFLHSLGGRLSVPPKTEAASDSAALQGRTLLLVDDDLRNVFAMSKILKKQGITVLVADNGEMALSVLAQHAEIDLVIMDIMMPVMDGYEATRVLRRNPDWAMLPVIALTARAMPGEQEKALASGATDYMSKPVDTDRLLQLIGMLLRREAGQ